MLRLAERFTARSWSTTMRKLQRPHFVGLRYLNCHSNLFCWISDFGCSVMRSRPIRFCLTPLVFSFCPYRRRSPSREASSCLQGLSNNVSPTQVVVWTRKRCVFLDPSYFLYKCNATNSSTHVLWKLRKKEQQERWSHFPLHRLLVMQHFHTEKKRNLSSLSANCYVYMNRRRYFRIS